MKRSRPWLTILVPPILLALVLGLSLATASCRSLGSDGTQTTASVPDSTTDVTPTTVSAGAGRISASNILFRDDFQDGDAQGWQVGGAWVVQQDGDLYTFNATGHGYAFVPKGVGWDGDYAFKCSYALSAGALGFSFDATRAGRYYVYVDRDLISLVKEDAAGTGTVLAQAQAPTEGEQHYLTVAKKTGTIQVYIDRTLWLAAEDSAPLAAGTIMLGALDGTTAWVDDVLVNKILRALPSGKPAVAAVDPGQVVAPPQEETDLNELPEDDEDVPELEDENLVEELPLPVVAFTGWENGDRPVPGAQAITVERGALVILEWQTENVCAAFLNGTPQPTDSSLTVQVHQDTNYELEVIGLDQATYSYYVNITAIDSDE